MIDLELTKDQLDELHKEASENPNARARKKCWVVYLHGKGYAHQEVADVMRLTAIPSRNICGSTATAACLGCWPSTTASGRGRWMSTRNG